MKGYKTVLTLDSALIPHYQSTIQQCSRTKDLAQGVKLHQEIVNKNLEHVTILRNCLVQMYGTCNRIDQASQIFNTTRERNHFSWNVMIAAYASNGHLLQAKNTFDSTPPQWRGVFSSNTLMVAYTKQGKIQPARDIFDSMIHRNVFSWNVMISSYARAGLAREALVLWSRMDVEPDGITYTSAVNACGEAEELEKGRSIHARARAAGILPSDVFLSTALVVMYGKCGACEDAERVFQSVSSNDVVLWTAMQMAYARNGNLLQASKLFSEMETKDVVSWTNMVVAYSSSGQTQQAKYFFDQITEKNSVTWTAMITGYTQNGQPQQALNLFLCMDSEGFLPNTITFITVLDACGALSEIAQGRRIHDEVLAIGVQRTVNLETSIVNMYGKCGALEEARELFDKMKERTIWSWNSMITSYAQKGHNTPAIQLFEALNLDGETPDEVTCTAVLSACSHAGFLEVGWRFFTSFTDDYGHPLNINHFVCMIDLLGRAGKLRQAEELLHTMPFKPTPTAWTALLNGCEMHRDSKRARGIPEQALGLDHGPYILMSNIQAPES